MPKKEPAEVFYAESTHSRLGPLWVAASRDGLWVASYGRDEAEFRHYIQERGPAAARYAEAPVADALRQIVEFLEGRRRQFDLQVDWRDMTDFQIAVRKAVMAIPYGSTASYGDVAAEVGRPRAARAVGGVQAANPISFIIPCHRVIGSDGSLAGYGGFGGTRTKAWLLELEAANL